MNFLAHARNHVHRPYVAAGTALPDWLSIGHRRLRLRRDGLPDRTEHHLAEELLEGVRTHLEEDVWFHASPAFVELNARFAVAIRGLPGAERARASVLAHILVEMLLDAELMRDDPRLLDAYYRGLARVDAGYVERAASRWLAAPPLRLSRVIEVFRAVGFLRAYTEDAGVVFRLAQVTRRTRMAPLPEGLLELLPGFRAEVREARDGLLAPPAPAADPVG